jgi:Cupin/Domain of unknown function (DUF3291)
VPTKLEKTKLENHDALTDVLNMLKPRGRVFCCSEMSAPWAMSLSASGYAHFHVIERGGAWLRVEGAKQVTTLVSGDLVIVPHGNGHVLADSPKTKPVPINRLIRGKADSSCLIRHGEGIYMALWWVEAGHIPTVDEAKERLEYLGQHGVSERAFTFKQIYDPLGKAADELIVAPFDPCPAT